MPAPNRRWFRFSLRTLFVVVTVAALMAYPLNWIYQRHKLLRDNAALISSMGVGFKLWGHGMPLRMRPPAKPPTLLGLFGERPVDELTLLFVVDKPPVESPPELWRAKRLFPEAEITCSYVDRNGNFFPAEQ